MKTAYNLIRPKPLLKEYNCDEKKMDSPYRVDFMLRFVSQLRHCPVFWFCGGRLGISFNRFRDYAGRQWCTRHWIEERKKIKWPES